MFTYEPGNRISVPLEAEGEDIDRAALTAANEDALSFARDVFESQRDQLNQLHAEWYNQIIFAHGNQDHAIDTVTGTPVRLPQKAYRTYDFTLPILQRVISKLGSVPTKREAHATTTDTTDIEAARTATDILSWAHEHFHFDELNAERLDWKVKTGNSIVYLPWMPNEGPTDQETGRPAGMPQMIVDPGFHWMWDPRATHYRRADYAARQTLQPEEWVERNFPDTYHLVPKNYYNEAYSSDFFQLALMGMNGSRSSYGLTQMNLPKGKGLVRIFEFFVKPCPRYPQGQLIVCAGTSGGPGVVLHSDINVYGTIPAIHFGMIRVTGRFWFDSITQYLMDPQTEVNHRVRQISRTAARTSNPQLAIPNNGPASEAVTDKIGGVVRYPPDSNPPNYIQPPQLPDPVYQSLEFSMRAMNEIATPFGMDSMERASKATSGIQLSLLDERETEMVAPMVRDDQLGINAMWEMLLNNFRLFGGARTINVLGNNNKYKARLVSGAMLSPNMRIILTEKNELPKSRTATWAEIIELAKAELIDKNDPMVKQRALVAIHRGDLSVEFRDGAADFKKAQRNIVKAIYSQEVPEPAPFDDLSIHIMAYTAYLKTDDFEELQVTDPVAAARVAAMVDAFNEARMFLLQQAADQAAVQAQNAMPPAGTEDGKKMTPQQGGAAAPQGPKATQGMEPLNPMADNGGAPLRGR